LLSYGRRIITLKIYGLIALGLVLPPCLAADPNKEIEAKKSGKEVEPAGRIAIQGDHLPSRLLFGSPFAAP